MPLPTINGNGNHNGTLVANLSIPTITLNANQDDGDDGDYQALFDNWDGVWANPDDDLLEDIGMPNPNEEVDDEIGMPNLLNGAAPNDEAGMPDPLGNGTMPNGV